MSNNDPFMNDHVMIPGQGTWSAWLADEHEADTLTEVDSAGYVVTKSLRALKAARAKMTEDEVDNEIGNVAREFAAKTPEYRSLEHNFNVLLDYLMRTYLHRAPNYEEVARDMDELYRSGFFTVESLQEAFSKLSAEGKLVPHDGVWRNLTAEELRQISRECAAVGTETAANRVMNHYIKLALGMNAPRNWKSLLNNPDFADVLADAMYFIWSNADVTYEEKPQYKDRILQYCGNRFPTFELLSEAWKRCQQDERDGFFKTDAERALERYMTPIS